jgi:hypothetical protein
VTYLYDAMKRNSRAHIWTGSDTGCRMWSTGGLKQSKPGWQVGDSKGERDICQMCSLSAAAHPADHSEAPMR